MNVPASHAYEMKLIPARLISVNRCYQRDTNSSEIREIVNNFDYHYVNPVKVLKKKDGSYNAFNGQHTAIGLRALFGDEYLVPCMVYYDIENVDDEAKLFEGCNTLAIGKKVSQMALWKSRIFRNEDTAIKIKDIVEKYGLKIASARNSGKRYIYALNALEKTFNDLGDNLFNESIEIIAKAWDGDPDSLTAPILKGMARFVKIYHDKYNKTELVRKLSRVPAMKVIVAGNASSDSSATKYSREILNIYNLNRRQENRLPDLFP